MPQDTTSDQDPDDNDAEFVEVDPSGRYGRYKEILGKGAFKKVYRGFDELEGIEVAWNQVKVSDLLRNSVDLERLYSEVHLLKTLKHKNIIKFYSSWVDSKNENINFITEIFTSGTLRQYRKKHKHVDLRALKKWSKQILEGLFYLHSHDPPVIHRDLKCDNIFVNGNQGEVKIGDLGLAAILLHAHSAHSVIGTPEFMAPELYEEEYNELVDIYAFGMCLLELVTFEYPYSECANAAQIYKKVTSGIKPAALEKVTDSRVKKFIEKCIANVSSRLSAKELLMDPFLQSDEDSESVSRSSRGEVKDVGDTPQHIDDGHGEKDLPAETSMDFTVQGQRKDLNTIFLKLKIADSTGHVRNIHFPFDIEVDTALAVASEMVEELDLTDQDVSAIAAMIDTEIQSHIPDWEPGDNSLDHSIEELTNPGSTLPETKDEGNLVLERTPSGRKYWSNSLKPGDEHSPSHPGLSPLCSQAGSHTEDDFIADSGSAEHCVDGKGVDIANDPIHSSNDISEGKESNGLVESPYGESNATDDQDSPIVDHPQKNSHIGYEDLTTHIGYEDFSTIVEKLENLLKQQQEELKELKMKHDAAISELLDGLSPEIRQMALDLCKHNVSHPGE